MLFVTAILAIGVTQLSLEAPIQDNPLYRCQDKARGEAPHGFTNATFTENVTECIYFCHPEWMGEQWYFGAIHDGTPCRIPDGIEGTCRGGYCMTDDEDYTFPNTTYSLGEADNRGNISEPGVPRPGLEKLGESGLPSNRHAPPLTPVGESYWPNAGPGHGAPQPQGPAMYEIEEDTSGWINSYEVAGTKVPT
ncbi:uncharacterized protein LOC144145614 [Haemaphysalis longicornis]